LHHTKAKSSSIILKTHYSRLN